METSDEEGGRLGRLTRTAAGVTRMIGGATTARRRAKRMAHLAQWLRCLSPWSRKDELGTPSLGDMSGVVTAEAAIEDDLRSPPILHASKSPIGEWKALEMENAVV